MTEFSLDPVAAPARRPRFYASPFDDQREFVAYVYGKALHAVSKGKPIPLILFMDAEQSAGFHRIVAERLKRHRRKKDRSDRTIESDVLKHLSRQSIPSSALTNLEGIENASVDIFGHGKPAHDKLASRGAEISMLWIENLVLLFGLKSISEIRLSTCYGAAGEYYKGSKENWLKHFEEDNLPALYKPENSFGARLYDNLRNKFGYAGKVRASLTALYSRPIDFAREGGEPEMHYAALAQIRRSDGKDKSIGTLRKRYVMHTFGDGNHHPDA